MLAPLRDLIKSRLCTKIFQVPNFLITRECAALLDTHSAAFTNLIWIWEEKMHSSRSRSRCKASTEGLVISHSSNRQILARINVRKYLRACGTFFFLIGSPERTLTQLIYLSRTRHCNYFSGSSEHKDFYFFNFWHKLKLHLKNQNFATAWNLTKHWITEILFSKRFSGKFTVGMYFLKFYRKIV